MKSDKKLLKIFQEKEESNKGYWEYEKLSQEEKSKIFDLVSKTNN